MRRNSGAPRNTGAPLGSAFQPMARSSGGARSRARRPSDVAGRNGASSRATTIYVADLADFAAVNEAYGSRFGGSPPPRSTLQVVGIPRGSKVEIEVLVVRQA